MAPEYTASQIRGQEVDTLIIRGHVLHQDCVNVVNRIVLTSLVVIASFHMICFER